jgi:LCP family protein required for cell wall assembly
MQPGRKQPRRRITYEEYRRLKRKHLLQNALIGCCLGNFLVFFGGFMCFALLLISFAASPPDTTNILILGSDARPDTNEELIARTDSIMVLSVNGEGQVVSLFSLPRDVFIESPNFGWLRANTIVRNAELNASGSGVDEMIASMERTFGFQIDHYVRVSFESFVDVVDAVGGVDVDVPKHIVDNEYPTPDYGIMRIEFQEGRQHMNGTIALIYARTRHADSDYERAERQQQVISAVIDKLTNPLHFYRVPAVGAAVAANVETDMNIVEMTALMPGFVLYGRSPDQIEQFVVDRNHVLNGTNGEAIPNMNSIRPWVEAHLH